MSSVKNKDPAGAYAAVIPKFTDLLINKKAPTINGDGSYSRDFVYIDNVLQINYLALTTSNDNALNEVYNVAFGESSTLNELFSQIKLNLLQFIPEIESIQPIYGPFRKGDIPHSLASIDKAKKLLSYNPEFSLKEGLEKTIKWYYESTVLKTS